MYSTHAPLCLPWGDEEPEQSSLCAKGAPSSPRHPRAQEHIVLGATKEEGVVAGGTQKGKNKSFVKQMMRGKSLGPGV